MTLRTTLLVSIAAISVLCGSFVFINRLSAPSVGKTVKNVSWTAVGAQTYFTIQKVTISGNFEPGTDVTFRTDIDVLKSFTHASTHVKLTYKNGIISKVAIDGDFPEKTPKTYQPGSDNISSVSRVDQSAPAGTYIMINDLKDPQGKILQSFQVTYQLA